MSPNAFDERLCNVAAVLPFSARPKNSDCRERTMEEGNGAKTWKGLLEAATSLGIHLRQPLGNPHLPVLWIPPKPPWTKLNIDASFNSYTGATRLGGILRNHLGETLWTSNLPQTSNPLHAECKALEVALNYSCVASIESCGALVGRWVRIALGKERARQKKGCGEWVKMGRGRGRRIHIILNNKQKKQLGYNSNASVVHQVQLLQINNNPNRRSTWVTLGWRWRISGMGGAAPAGGRLGDAKFEGGRGMFDGRRTHTGQYLKYRRD
ncbi:hypothetical protein DH2020_047949 [Rehmannia glutinosa]|uniref:RNase H type-1 domain-containing protein n=1 Tax=Rehmannia glutinosa TaxID=99300 RepID=A0ABR0U792_REHGL